MRGVEDGLRIGGFHVFMHGSRWRWRCWQRGACMVREESAGGRAALAVPRVVRGAGEARLAREEAKYEAASAPVRFPPVSGLLVSGDEKPF